MRLKRRIAIAAATLILGAAATGLSAAPASAEIEFSFHFAGMKLAAGVTVGMEKVKEVSQYELIVAKPSASDVCKEAKYEKPLITGGIPATTSLKIVFANCTGKFEGEVCTSEKAESEALTGEQTESIKPTEGIPVTRFVPVKGNVVFRFRLKCPLFGVKESTIEGAVAAVYEGALFSEAVNRVLSFPFPKITEVRNVAKTPLSTEPTGNGVGAFVGGQTEFRWEGSPKWGPF